ncbi:TolC family protein [Flammeovirga kamogawensis]|uniref:TolC family protein n=1 Tax=Flammeovirga kamogawensis TaxID=373891 RepID=A0ABX8H298_9BACT|nr:TolC family protein [Flammeovirga kamogawensis]MBB6460217.1 outer membrane protein TolC [Flammeovirga kamogawensis]QWG10029.1 TolC family protein [Flammeovirga kamogawensis]TRX65537.1 TolC family protein [Flammeovirga kamogawensis]
MNLKYTISLFILTITINATAQDRPLYVSSQIDSLSSIGLENNYLLKAKDAEILIANENLIREKKSWLSSFSFSVSTFKYSANNTLTSVSAFSDIGLGLTIDLFTITSLNNRVRAAQHLITKKQMEYRHQQKVVEREYITIYTNYIKSTEKLKIITEQENSQKEMLLITKDKLLRGEAKMEDYLLLEQKLHETQVQKVEAEVGAVLAKHELELLISE